MISLSTVACAKGNIGMKNRKLQVILIGGQSNAVGCTDKFTLDEQYRNGNYENIMLYQEGNFSPGAMETILKGIRWGMGNNPGQMGIEYGIAEELNDVKPQVGLIRFAYGGTSLIYHWQTKFDQIPTEVNQKGYCYYEFVNTVKRGLQTYRDAGYNVTVKGMVWMQGESDTDKTEEDAKRYGDNLRVLFSQIRNDLDFPDLKIIIGGISTQPPLAPYSDIVREKQKEYCESDSQALYVDNTDIPIGKDGWHYNGNEDLVLGKRFGKYIKEYLLN